MLALVASDGPQRAHHLHRPVRGVLLVLVFGSRTQVADVPDHRILGVEGVLLIEHGPQIRATALAKEANPFAQGIGDPQPSAQTIHVRPAQSQVELAQEDRHISLDLGPVQPRAELRGVVRKLTNQPEARVVAGIRPGRIPMEVDAVHVVGLACAVQERDEVLDEGLPVAKVGRRHER
jgi:hypothetical protein